MNAIEDSDSSSFEDELVSTFARRVCSYCLDASLKCVDD